jgi:radical SAM protein with 4Fe4S-binding SPASM domain
VFGRQQIPALFSFVSYRREDFGGYLFNPYLFQELPLDEFEMAVVERCDGRTTAHDLVETLCRQFRTDRATAESSLVAALHKLNGHFALRWRDTQQDVQDLAQDSHVGTGERNTLHCRQVPQQGCLSAPLSIIWEITHACNLGCLHCLSACGRMASGELSTEEAKALIDQLARARVFSITLGGGEPLVRDDVFELIEHATARNMAVRLSTNGYAVTEETLRRLADLNVFSVQVSVDGLEDTHDFLRQRKGAFERAIKALRLFGLAGYHTFMTVTASASNMDEVPTLVDVALQLGVSTFKVSPYVPLGRAVQNKSKLIVSHAGIKELASRMRQKQQLAKNAMYLQVDGLFPWLLDPEPPRTSWSGTYGPGCSAGVSQVVVSYDGAVYACPYMRDTTAGNIHQANIMDIWRNESFFARLRLLDQNQIRGKCRDCAYRPSHCSGGCRGAAMAAFGDLYAEDPNCWLGV